MCDHNIKTYCLCRPKYLHGGRYLKIKCCYYDISQRQNFFCMVFIYSSLFFKHFLCPLIHMLMLLTRPSVNLLMIPMETELIKIKIFSPSFSFPSPSFSPFSLVYFEPWQQVLSSRTNKFYIKKRAVISNWCGNYYDKPVYPQMVAVQVF